MSSIVRFGRGSARSLGTHRDGGLEIILLEKGALNWQIEGRVERVAAGSVYFSLPWQEHGSVDEFEPGHFWHWVQIALDGRCDRPRRRFRFHPALGFTPAEERRISGLLTSGGRHCYRAGVRMAWVLPTLVEELGRPERAGAPAYIDTLARLAVLELARCIEAGETAAENTESERRVDAFIARLREQPDQEWTLDEMGRRCGLGRTRFAALCRRISGDSPLRLVNRTRIEHAKVWLKTTKEPVTAIAFACGFSSSQYFARVFRMFTGMEASAYRRRHAVRPASSG